MNKSFDFTGQKITDAVVPLLVGDMASEWRDPSAGQSLHVLNLANPPTSEAMHSTWVTAWGLFKYSNEVGSTVLAETWGMFKTSLWDFCAGSLASSFGFRVGRGIIPPSDWGAHHPLALKGCRFFAGHSPELADIIPNLNNAIEGCPEIISDVDAGAIMQRSLLFNVLSSAFGHSRRMLLGGDVSSGNLASTFNRCTELPALASSLRTSYINSICPLVLSHAKVDEPLDHYNNAEISRTFMRHKLSCSRTDPVMNANTNRMVSTFAVAIGDSTRIGPVGGTEYKELDDRGSVYGNYPEWWRNAADKAGYARMFPRTPFMH